MWITHLYPTIQWIINYFILYIYEKQHCPKESEWSYAHRLIPCDISSLYWTVETHQLLAIPVLIHSTVDVIACGTHNVH